MRGNPAQPFRHVFNSRHCLHTRRAPVRLFIWSPMGRSDGQETINGLSTDVRLSFGVESDDRKSRCHPFHERKPEALIAQRHQHFSFTIPTRNAARRLVMPVESNARVVE